MGLSLPPDFASRTATPLVHPPRKLDWRRALHADRAIDLSKYRLTEKVLTRGQPLFAQGEENDYVYVALSGWVSLEHVLSNGSSQIIDFALPGALIGHQRSHDGSFTVSAQCMTDSSVIVFQRRKLLELVREHDPLYQLYEATLADDSARAQRRLANVTRRRGAEKLADLIVELVDRASAAVVDEDEDPMTLPVSQIQFAAALGLTNVYVSRVAKVLTARGLIAWRKRRLHVIDPDGLRAIAGPTEAGLRAPGRRA